jgi:hypothetical protein
MAKDGFVARPDIKHTANIITRDKCRFSLVTEGWSHMESELVSQI